MKRLILTIAIALVTGLTVSAQFSNETEKVEFNKTYNDYCFIFKEAYNYLKTNQIKQLDVYCGNKKVKTFTYSRDITHVDYFFKRFFYYVADSTDNAITKIRMVTKTNRVKIISIISNKIKFEGDTNLENYCVNHILYMQKTDKSGHNQGTMTMSDRLEKDNVRHWGDLTEICTYDFNFKIPRTDIKKALSIIETYYRFRNLTEHWDAIVDPLNKTYSTYFVEKTNKIFAITVMLEDALIK